MEHYTRWEPVSGIVAPFLSVDIRTGPEAFTVRGVGYGGPDTPARDLDLTFAPNVLAFTSYDEFAHPWQGSEAGPVPKLAAPWAKYAFPLLVVHDSPWFRATVDDETQPRAWYTHYRIVSLDHTVDLITSGAVHAEWVPPAV